MARCSVLGPIRKSFEDELAVGASGRFRNPAHPFRREGESALLAVESPALQVGIELDLLQATRSPEALLVPSRDVDGGPSPLVAGFGALQNDDFSGHGLKGNRGNSIEGGEYGLKRRELKRFFAFP